MLSVFVQVPKKQAGLEEPHGNKASYKAPRHSETPIFGQEGCSAFPPSQLKTISAQRRRWGRPTAPQGTRWQCWARPPCTPPQGLKGRREAKSRPQITNSKEKDLHHGELAIKHINKMANGQSPKKSTCGRIPGTYVSLHPCQNIHPKSGTIGFDPQPYCCSSGGSSQPIIIARHPNP